MILETIPSLNFYLFKVEDRKLFIPTVGDREWGGGEGEGGRGKMAITHPIPSLLLRFQFYFKQGGKERKEQ